MLVLISCYKFPVSFELGDPSLTGRYVQTCGSQDA